MDEKSSLIDSIVEKMRESPDSIALRCNAKQLTYREIEEKSRYYATVLRNEGVKNGDIVGITIRRGIDMIVWILSILRVGACFLPIDRTLPALRKQFIIANSNVRCLVADEEYEEVFKDLQIINISSIITSQEMLQVDLPRIENKQLAYVMYTSGSTGLPKGVMIEHGALKKFVTDIQGRIDFSQIKSVLCLTNMSFDIFIVESLLPLALGKEVVIAEEKLQKNPLLLAKLILNEKIDMVQMTPTSMSMLLQFKRNNKCLLHVKLILIGGEPFPLHLLLKLRSVANSAAIYNMYGPAEATVWVTAANITHASTIHLGEVFESSQITIMDEDGNPTRPGETGELYISGSCLARGYLNNLKKTNERFMEKSDGYCIKRMYRTGDLVNLTEDGRLLFAGRVDNQVKIRGHRIELEEVEQTMSSFHGVKQAIVFVNKNLHGQEQYLSALYSSDQAIPLRYWHDFLEERLPDYMIPAEFKRIDYFPTNSNGKIDRKLVVKTYTDQGECDAD